MMTENQYLFKALHGSKLYGINTPESDTDIKCVVLPTARDIVLGKTNWSHSNKTDNRPNNSNDIDIETHDLMKFTELLAKGSPFAIEMLFTPESFYLADPHPVFNALKEHKEKIVTKQSKHLLGYCRLQAMNYGINADRVKAVNRVKEVLEGLIEAYGENARLGNHLDTIVNNVIGLHVKKAIKTTSNGAHINNLVVENRFTPETASLGEALKVSTSLVNRYGKSTFTSENASSKDWKTLSHALRIGYQAMEMFSTGHMTFPRPEADFLMSVRKGAIPADKVVIELCSLLENVEQASVNSCLPDRPDEDFLETLVVDTYSEQVQTYQIDKKTTFQP